jgi:hypothetical protein
MPSRAVELAEVTRTRCEELPGAIVGEFRRRVNPLDLATKHDVETQSRLGRNRVSFVLKEFLEEQRSHDEALLASLRAELREELQSFAAALSDDLLVIDAPAPLIETDGADDEWTLSMDDEGIDLADEEMPTRRRTRSETYE